MWCYSHSKIMQIRIRLWRGSHKFIFTRIDELYDQHSLRSFLSARSQAGLARTAFHADSFWQITKVSIEQSTDGRKTLRLSRFKRRTKTALLWKAWAKTWRYLSHTVFEVASIDGHVTPTHNTYPYSNTVHKTQLVANNIFNWSAVLKYLLHRGSRLAAIFALCPKPIRLPFDSLKNFKKFFME